ncbi:carbonic anhydrase [Pelagicoccus sp. SDUM812003]|uniref:carbonic anhydrase n=1 Tax=Pelagicoccus sp. SDUM812003 TaxID=3041267 RepID=UPI00280D84B1|nr:carbonic anhydrase [Pelagicoccus sp. SDUM812003]MDQ8203634.1 carbonic anhydrase [Pelagicoccus sp. SDUM812003]
MLVSKESNTLPKSLISGHRKYLQNDFTANEHLHARLASEGQAPKVMWVGCADSRVSPELILGAKPGELFILRNVANIIPPLEADEASVGSALVFAVESLKVNHIVVCGHSDCGGVKALSQLGVTPMDRMLASWIEYAVPALEDNMGNDLESLIKTNVVMQAERLLEYPCVMKAASTNQLAIHACYYNISNGALTQYSPLERAWKEFS